MNQVFPFGFDNPTTFYLIVYLLTLVLHAVPMAYVLAGSLWLSWAALFPGNHEVVRTKQPISQLLRDWMPFALSGAITAGVAPLLFIQILYRQQFYTANLLLGWRWMIVIPVLVIVFYLLYVAKSKAIGQWSLPLRTLLALSISGCFVMIAFCWTANHLLSLDPERWPSSYSSGDVVASSMALILRLSAWITGTIPVMAIVILWQFQSAAVRSFTYNQTISESTWTDLRQSGVRQLSTVSFVALIASTACGLTYLITIPTEARAVLFSVVGLPWLILLLLTQATQTAIWFRTLKAPVNLQFRISTLIVMSILCLLSLIATAIVRELIRLSQADLNRIAENTSRASQVGGFWLFVVFTVINTALIAWCISLSMRSQQKTTELEEK